ncbi:MAG: ribosome biogenesis GTPase Der [Ilumatobacteraceae bacterium]|jgi:GTP-binding protein
MTTLPTVVIVGRPNVGKSTLFNRLLGEQAAIVEDRPGVTRDRFAREVEWLGRRFLLVDTGGWMPSGSELDAKVSRQVEVAVRDADLVAFVVDVSVGVLDDDEAVGRWLQTTGKDVVVVANKVDTDRREPDVWELLRLGLGEPVSVSALHGRKAGDLLDEVCARLGAAGGGSSPDPGAGDAGAGDAARDGAPRVAIVGRPNVGKSTLFNRLVGEDRSIVHDMPGTTRDAIDTRVEWPDGPIVFIDTAGMRRRSRVDETTEQSSVMRSLRAVDEADIAILVVDASEGVTAQDQRLAERVDAAGCPVVVCLNKWDLLDDDAKATLEAEVGRRLGFVGESPVLRIAASSGRGVHRVGDALREAMVQYRRRVPTRDVNRVIARAQQQQPAAAGARVLYALQGASDPPTFTLFVNRELPPSYLRYLERALREAFDLGATPVKLRVRQR